MEVTRIIGLDPTAVLGFGTAIVSAVAIVAWNLRGWKARHDVQLLDAVWEICDGYGWRDELGYRLWRVLQQESSVKPNPNDLRDHADHGVEGDGPVGRNLDELDLSNLQSLTGRSRPREIATTTQSSSVRPPKPKKPAPGWAPEVPERSPHGD